MKKASILAFLIIFSFTLFAQKKDRAIASKWGKIKLKNDLSTYKRFINQYPESAYADSARNSIEQINYQKEKTSFNQLKEYGSYYDILDFAINKCQNKIIKKNANEYIHSHFVLPSKARVDSILSITKDNYKLSDLNITDWNLKEPLYGMPGIIKIHVIQNTTVVTLGYYVAMLKPGLINSLALEEIYQRYRQREDTKEWQYYIESTVPVVKLATITFDHSNVIKINILSNNPYIENQTSKKLITCKRYLIEGYRKNILTITPSSQSNSMVYQKPLIVQEKTAVGLGIENLSKNELLNQQLHYDSIKDERDGNIYKTIRIGEMVWMAENLRYLPKVNLSGEGSPETPFYYVNEYEGYSVNSAKETANYKVFGVLYNQPATENACPSGWHLPSVAEWDKLKEDLLKLQDSLQIDSTVKLGVLIATSAKPFTKSANLDEQAYLNISGFSALPGGGRTSYNNGFRGILDDASWWTSTLVINEKESLYYRMQMGFNKYTLYNLEQNRSSKAIGLSIRCVKND